MPALVRLTHRLDLDAESQMLPSDLKALASKYWTVGDDARIRLAVKGNLAQTTEEEEERVAKALLQNAQLVVHRWESQHGADGVKDLKVRPKLHGYDIGSMLIGAVGDHAKSG
jgi:predicted N-acetyltransferase YhbS